MAVKKKSGIKLHIGVDVLGLPHTIMLTTANYNDREGAIEMISYYDCSDRLYRLEKILADAGYSGSCFRDSIKSICNAEVEVVKRSELHSFVVIPKRWIVERTFGWLDKYRRFWKNCERKLLNSFNLITLAFVRLLLNRY